VCKENKTLMNKNKIPLKRQILKLIDLFTPMEDLLYILIIQAHGKKKKKTVKKYSTSRCMQTPDKRQTT
jgi:hypothetical protein